ncbi:MAG: (2Fe-2S) ferredoxin domain-containing protein [Cyanomargarita calcarea GSE-NOS-MK-12-04C]|jgi:hypothetical protein|uniref:(2Fe-2S) ferredoxin domain-containing protein n=1 Tax=Cyanomargarita calcarea GSE-NOS-MK-12-04C TaxID=2839659 RepID=A0A951QJY9_9CYAN|nr:(2Fe-2S) ferredoxin domain-containing protein [Cyanomargarita calcarea GSE-NOS-MK-12-04C]
MGKKYQTLSQFNLSGQFLGFVEDTAGKFKYMRLILAKCESISPFSTEEVQIKLPKELRASMDLSLVHGDEVRIVGVSKLDQQTGKIKLKAYQVTPVGGCPKQEMSTPMKARILVCQKSGCRKHGGNGLLSEIEAILQERGLLGHVTIEYTSCQKRCNKAPNCVLQLGKKEYNLMHPRAIASLLEHHLG